MEYKCQIYAHCDEKVIGMCQNVDCKQQSRLVCLKCVKLVHKEDKDFQVSDIMSFDELNYMVNDFNEETIKKNQNRSQMCQINKYLLLKEFQQYMSYWLDKYNQWHYAEQALQQIEGQEKGLNLENYINNKDNKYNLKEFLIKSSQKSQSDIDQILKGELNTEIKKKFSQQKIELINEVKDILDKLQASIKSKINKSPQQMFQFMIDQYEKENQNQIPFIYEKFNNFYQIMDNRYIDEKIKQFNVIDITQSDDYFQQLICRNGLLLKKLGRFDESIKYFKQLIHLFPKNCQAYINLAEILKDHIDYQMEIQYLNKRIQQIDSSPNSDDYYEIQNLKHYLAYFSKDPSCYISRKKQYKISTQQLTNYSYQQIKNRDYKEIEQYLDQCIKNNPKYGDAYSKKAQILKEQKNFEEALQCLDQCIRINPNYENAYYKKAIILFRNDKYEEAIKCLDLCIHLNPNSQEAYYQKGKVFQNNIKTKDKIKYLEKMIKVNPNNEFAKFKKAQLYNMINREEEAQKCLEKCIQVNQNYEDAYCELGYSLKQQKKHQEAIQLWDKCIKVNPNYYKAYSSKVEILSILGSKNQAIGCIDQFIQLNPNHAGSYWDKAQLLIKESNIKEAIECLDQCIKANPNFCNAYCLKAKLIISKLDISLTNYYEALESLDKCISINPNNEQAYH